MEACLELLELLSSRPQAAEWPPHPVDMASAAAHASTSSAPARSPPL